MNKDSRVYIVEASAGSGKTTALANRYIQLLTGPPLHTQDIPISSILALTFTNKAAIQMKERIFYLLKKTALRQPSNPATEKASRIIDYIIKNYSLFKVETIDSFVNLVLSGCAFRLGGSANFKIEKDYTGYLQYSLDKLIDKTAFEGPLLGLFKAFLTQYLHVENRSGWFPKKDILDIMKFLYSESNKFTGSFKSTGAGFGEIVLLKRNILADMKELNSAMPGGVNAKFLSGFSSFLKRSRGNFNIEDVSSMFARPRLPLNKGSGCCLGAQALWDKIRVNLARLAELESVSAFNYYIEIFNILAGELEALARKDDVLFLEGLNKKASFLFDENFVTVPEIYYRLAVGIKHILIDEFQDTSALECANLFPMIEEALSTGGSFFCVGDKKQAIYRFKGSDTSLIGQTKERFGVFGINVDVLNKNYRSARNIVEFNNRFFSTDNIKRFLQSVNIKDKDDFKFDEADISRIAGVFTDSNQVCKKGAKDGYVRAEFIGQAKKEGFHGAVKGRVVSLIKALSESFEYKDIALLTRKNEEAAILTQWLLENNIPVESERTLDIRQNQLIKELISFLKFLDSPKDNIHFASFILGDIFLKASGLKREDMQGFIFRACGMDKQKGRDVFLYKEFKKEFAGAWSGYIEDFFKNTGFVPVYELLVSIFDKFGCIASFAYNQGFFMRLLELVKEQEQERQSLKAFLDFFDNAPDEDLYVNVSSSDSVKVLTIHKSKGLEFGAVVVPFLKMSIKPRRDILSRRQDGLYYMRLKKIYEDFSLSISQAYKQEYIKSFVDELNSVYVAFTRPRQELYIFIQEKAAGALGMEGMFLDFKQQGGGIIEIGAPAARASEKAGCNGAVSKKPYIMDLAPSRYTGWIQYLKDEFTQERVLQNRQMIEKGKVCHFILSMIGDLTDKDVESVLEEAIRQARFKFPYFEDFSGVRAMLAGLINSEPARRFFFLKESGAVCYQEKEVVNSYADTKRIDRLIDFKDEVWIIDYKSRAEGDDASYSLQVKEYAGIAKDLYPGKKIKAFLLYLEELKVKQIDG